MSLPFQGPHLSTYLTTMPMRSVGEQGTPSHAAARRALLQGATSTTPALRTFIKDGAAGLRSCPRLPYQSSLGFVLLNNPPKSKLFPHWRASLTSPPHGAALAER